MKQFGEFRFLPLCLLAASAYILSIGIAHAYVGPGLGAGVVAVVLGVIGSVFLAVFAVLWYPLKRIMKKRKAAAVNGNRPSAEQ